MKGTKCEYIAIYTSCCWPFLIHNVITLQLHRLSVEIPHLKLLNRILARQICWFSLNNWN